MLTQSQSVLVVEDSSGIALVLQLMLEGEGFRVIIATSLEAALETLRDSSVDLILTDAFSSTPQMALESVEPLLRAAGDLPIALITGHQVSIEAARAAGFCAVIRKPFDFDTLLDQLRECLSGTKAVP